MNAMTREHDFATPRAMLAREALPAHDRTAGTDDDAPERDDETARHPSTDYLMLF